MKNIFSFLTTLRFTKILMIIGIVVVIFSFVRLLIGAQRNKRVKKNRSNHFLYISNIICWLAVGFFFVVFDSLFEGMLGFGLIGVLVVLALLVISNIFLDLSIDALDREEKKEKRKKPTEVAWEI